MSKDNIGSIYFHNILCNPLNENEGLKNILNYLINNVIVDRVNIFTYNSEKNILQSEIVYFNQHILIGDEELNLNNDINDDQRILSIKKQSPIISSKELIFPLFYDNKLYGLVTADRSISHKPFTKKEIEFIKEIAFFICVGIRQNKLLLEREIRIKQLNALLEINMLLGSNYSLSHILKVILKDLIKYGRFDRARLYLHKKGNIYKCVYSESIVDKINFGKDNLYDVEFFYKKNFSDIYYVVPLKNNDVNPYGFIEVDNLISQIKLDKTQINFLKIVAAQLSLFLKNYNLIKKLKEISITDPLTGVFNYRYFMEYLEIEMEKAKRFKYPFSLLFLDVDNFKQINDQYGHLKGDEVLKRVVEAIKIYSRKSDILCRYGGDEFVIIASHIDKKQAKAFAKRLSSNSILVEFDNEVKEITFSVGISSFPEDAKDIQKLLKKADDDLYIDKRRKKKVK